MNETDTLIAVEEQHQLFWRRRWLTWVALGFVVVAMLGAIAVEWGLRQMQPLMRKKVVETLSARFHSPVELDRLELSVSRDIIVSGAGLRILYLAGPTKPDVRPNAPPMLTVASFEFRTGWRELLEPTTRVLTVKVRGLQVNIPPKQERGAGVPDDPKKRGQSKLGIAVDRIECTDTKLVIEASTPGKKGLEFDIGRLLLTDVGAMKALGYEAVLKNPKPVGDVASKGHFGPWQDDNPRDTPVDGDYSFAHADLSSIHGIGGVLDSTGRFAGTLGDIAVNGVADVPSFRLDISDHPLPLHVEFRAEVDGTTGDTRLKAVRARVGRSNVTATGAVTRMVGMQGHRTELDAAMEHGRLEDMQTLSMKGNPTLMRGELKWKAHLVIPPGPVSVSRKMALQGTYAIAGAMLNNPKMQEKIDSLSMRAQGRPRLANAEDADVVGSSVSGRFSQANAVVDVSDVDYRVPGAQLLLNGQMNLAESTYEFHGTVRTQATASQMVTGWKSLLLSPFDKMLMKNGAGVELPIRVTGTRSTYELGLDLPHDRHAPGAPLPPAVGSVPK